LKGSKPAIIAGDEIFNATELAVSDFAILRKKAREYGKKLRGTYRTSTGDDVDINRNTIIEILQHDYKDIPHLQSIAAIPELIANGVYIDTLGNKKEGKTRIAGFDYYLEGGSIAEMVARGRVLALDKKRSGSMVTRNINDTENFQTVSGKKIIQLGQEVKSTSLRLYQLFPEARESYLENRKEDVRNAVERMF